MDIFEQLLDPENTENIVLYNENNEAVEFEQIAIVPLDGELCVILKPAQPMESIGEDEALVFKAERYEDEMALVIVEDDQTIDRVFAEYYEMLEEARGSEE